MKVRLGLVIAVFLGVLAGWTPSQAAFPPPSVSLWSWTGTVDVRFSESRTECATDDSGPFCSRYKKRFDGEFRLKRRSSSLGLFAGDAKDIPDEYGKFSSNPNRYINTSGTYSGSGGELSSFQQPPGGDIGPVPMSRFATSIFPVQAREELGIVYRRGYDAKRGFTGKFWIAGATGEMPPVEVFPGVFISDTLSANFSDVELVLDTRGKDGPRRNGLSYNWSGSRIKTYSSPFGDDLHAEWTYNLTLGLNPKARCFKPFRKFESAEKMMAIAREKLNKAIGSAKKAARRHLMRAAKDAKQARKAMRIC